MKFLFVCTGNISRSPAAEEVFRRITNGAQETRSVGISPYCPRPICGDDLRWADVVAVMEEDHRAFIVARWADAGRKLRVLGIEDRYHRHDPELIRLLEVKLTELLADVGARDIGGK
ncbi:MAG: phosphotyrosine protein phosphatase [Candidatus Rokubacteria bacterium]|nr:phosphotyrosine protein phosphatase [Candidatus Rokubacteria bacterium]